MIVGYLVGYILGVTFGWWVFYLRPRRRLPPSPESLMCCAGCGHHFSFRDAHGRCHKLTYDIDGVSYKCNCQRYIGPLPVEDELDRALKEDEATKKAKAMIRGPKWRGNSRLPR